MNIIIAIIAMNGSSEPLGVARQNTRLEERRRNTEIGLNVRIGASHVLPWPAGCDMWARDHVGSWVI